MSKIKVMVVDDHEIFRDGVKLVISQSENYNVVSDACNGKEFLDIIDAELPDIVLMDISMPIMDGVEASKKALAKYPHLKIVTLSMFGEEEYYYKMIEAGVKAVVLKKSGTTELLHAIDEVAKGNNYFSQDLLKKLVFRINSPKSQEKVKITQREEEVLNLICNGYTNKEIAEKLFISVKTVDRHRTSLLQKTETRNSAHLVMYSIRHKLVDF